VSVNASTCSETRSSRAPAVRGRQPRDRRATLSVTVCGSPQNASRCAPTSAWVTPWRSCSTSLCGRCSSCAHATAERRRVGQREDLGDGVDAAAQRLLEQREGAVAGRPRQRPPACPASTARSRARERRWSEAAERATRRRPQRAGVARQPRSARRARLGVEARVRSPRDRSPRCVLVQSCRRRAFTDWCRRAYQTAASICAPALRGMRIFRLAPLWAQYALEAFPGANPGRITAIAAERFAQSRGPACL